MPRGTAQLHFGHPFTRASALAAGITTAQLHGPEFRQLFHGVYAHVGLQLTPVVWVEAALLVHPPTAYASHCSAARVYGLPLPKHPHEHITVFRRQDRRRPQLFRHHLAPDNPAVRVLKGLRISSPEQLFCELSEQLTLVDLVVAGDALVRWHGTTPERLVEAAEGAARRVRALVRRAASYVRSGVDSPMETRLRMLIVLAGLPEPKVNHKIYWEDGTVRFRFDLCYPERKLVVEYDGRQHRDDLDQWDTDISRRDWMDAEQWGFVPVVARGIYKRPDETLERVHVALVRSGAPNVPRRLREEWRRYFPVTP